MGFGGGCGGGVGQGGCEWKSEAFVKIQKNIFFFWGGGGGGQGGCERRSEAFVKIQKINIFFGVGGGGGGWGGRVGKGGGVRLGVRVDVNGEVKFL